MVLVAGFSCRLMFSTFFFFASDEITCKFRDYFLNVKVVFRINSLAIHHEKRTILVSSDCSLKVKLTL